jgi:hypothetical protein
MAALTEVGFTDSAAYSFSQNWRVANANRYIESILSGTVRAQAALASQSGAAAADVRSYIADYFTRFSFTNRRISCANARDHWQRNATMIYALHESSLADVLKHAANAVSNVRRTGVGRVRFRFQADADIRSH